LTKQANHCAQKWLASKVWLNRLQDRRKVGCNSFQIHQQLREADAENLGGRISVAFEGTGRELRGLSEG